MKKKYEKPMIEVESLILDMPVAAGCSPEGIDDANTLVASGYFDGGCRYKINDEVEENQHPWMADDKLCYYSNAVQLFTS